MIHLSISPEDNGLTMDVIAPATVLASFSHCSSCVEPIDLSVGKAPFGLFLCDFLSVLQLNR